MNGLGYNSREKLITQLRLRLADGMVDVELDRAHYDTAIDLALARYRQLSSGSVEESFIFIQTQPSQVEYTLPDEVIEVERLYRRGVGANSGTGSDFDPFDAAFNNMYLLNAGVGGGLATFDAFSQFKETVGRIFGAEFNFRWNRHTKKLTILRSVRNHEDIGVGVRMYKPEEILLSDIYASDWLARWALAESKFMLGEARSKYQSGLPGAGGNITLNGEALKNEAVQEMENLKQSIHNMEEGNEPLGFIVG